MNYSLHVKVIQYDNKSSHNDAAIVLVDTSTKSVKHYCYARWGNVRNMSELQLVKYMWDLLDSRKPNEYVAHMLWEVEHRLSNV